MDLLRNARQALQRRQQEVDEADLEQQTARRQQSQMSEQNQSTRPTPASSVLRRFADMPRPSRLLSRQSSNTQRSHGRPDMDGAIASPKSPPMNTATTHSMNTAPMPYTYSWSQSQARSQQYGIAEPTPVVPAQHISDNRRPPPVDAAAANPAGQQHQQGVMGGAGAGGPNSSPAKPRKTLGCIPVAKSRRLRALITRSLVSGGVLSLMTTVFLCLFLTHNIYNSEFAVLLVLMVLVTAAYFMHSVVRTVMYIRHPPSAAEEQAAEELYQQRRRAAAGVAGSGALGGMPSVYGPGGYAIPNEPIQVVLARDEEAAGVESVTTKTLPPAYGLWRETVRVDPNRIYWQRNEAAAPAVPAVPTQPGQAAPGAAAARSLSNNSDSDSDSDSSSPRPPSYMSDDGVQYVVEAQPRSTAPTTEVPLSHPAEAGRIGRPPAW